MRKSNTQTYKPTDPEPWTRNSDRGPLRHRCHPEKPSLKHGGAKIVTAVFQATLCVLGVGIRDKKVCKFPLF